VNLHFRKALAFLNRLHGAVAATVDVEGHYVKLRRLNNVLIQLADGICILSFGLFLYQ
jgi:hypothetical protein